MQKTLRQHLEMVYKSRISAISQDRFLARKMRSVSVGPHQNAVRTCKIYLEVSPSY